jgi:hypothetical protein
MKFKLSRQQLIALRNVFKTLVGADIVEAPESFEARLLMALLLSIFKQLSRKYMDTPLTKPHVSIRLNQVEALAFWIYFSKFHEFSVHQVYEANLIGQINSSIHQQLSSNQFINF